jgi:Holliday junction resolvase-like predicted endonuclease
MLNAHLRNMSDPLLITKASGKQVPFDLDKLRSSMRRSGATEEQAQAIAEALLPQLSPGISTRKLYRMAFALLHKRSKQAAGRYRLKQAIMDLGPSGFPFEQFVARLLAQDGYTTQVGVVVQGQCVAHEVDVIAEKDSHRYLVECKYRNTRGKVSDVKVPLYIQARFLDVVERWRSEPGNSHRGHHGWVVTNTRFTSDALQYGQCVGLRMVGWDQPAKGSLKARIDRSGLYPLTCLSTLTKAEKERLLEQGLVLVREVADHAEALRTALVQPPRVKKVLAEVRELCGDAPEP